MLTSKNDRGIQIRRKIKFYYYGVIYSFRHLLRFARYGKCDFFKSQSYFITQIILSYHVVEKCLAMNEFEPGHGVRNLVRLIGDLLKYKKLGYDTGHIQYVAAVQSVYEYEEKHKQLKFDLPQEVVMSIDALHREIDVPCHVQPSVTANSFFINSSSDFYKFSKSRHSVRCYSEKNIPNDIIENVLQIAQTTPTPCNRQPNKTYVIKNKDLIKSIADVQGGGRGFVEKANKLLVITSAVDVFSPQEMNEVWKSGGMYAMNMLYALHYYKICACPLVWNERINEDKQLRKWLNIPNNEEIIMLISIGYPLDEFRYVSSARNDFKEAMVEIGSKTM